MIDNEYLLEADDEIDTSSKDAMVRFIVTNFYRFINAPDRTDTRQMLMLVAALGVLSASSDDDRQAISASKRLTQAALARRGRSNG